MKTCKFLAPFYFDGGRPKRILNTLLSVAGSLRYQSTGIALNQFSYLTRMQKKAESSCTGAKRPADLQSILKLSGNVQIDKMEQNEIL